MANGSTQQRVLLDDPHMTVVIDDARRIVRSVRTAVPYQSIGELETLIQRIAELTRSFDPAKYVMLIDSREAPLRNDPAFEQAQRGLASLTRRFKKTAVLMKTAVGMLQAERLKRQRPEGELGPQTFDDEDKAMRYLLSGDDN